MKYCILYFVFRSFRLLDFGEFEIGIGEIDGSSHDLLVSEKLKLEESYRGHNMSEHASFGN